MCLNSTIVSRITGLTNVVYASEAWLEMEVDEDEYSRGNLTEHVENDRICRVYWS